VYCCRPLFLDIYLKKTAGSKEEINSGVLQLCRLSKHEKMDLEFNFTKPYEKNRTTIAIALIEAYRNNFAY